MDGRKEGRQDVWTDGWWFGPLAIACKNAADRAAQPLFFFLFSAFPATHTPGVTKGIFIIKQLPIFTIFSGHKSGVSWVLGTAWALRGHLADRFSICSRPKCHNWRIGWSPRSNPRPNEDELVFYSNLIYALPPVKGSQALFLFRGCPLKSPKNNWDTWFSVGLQMYLHCACLSIITKVKGGVAWPQSGRLMSTKYHHLKPQADGPSQIARPATWTRRWGYLLGAKNYVYSWRGA